MREITLAEALVQLKRLTARIDKKILKLDPITVTVAGKVPHLTVSPEEFAENAIADLASVRTLVKNRRAIKGAIVLANAMTKVKVGDEEMTIAEAIERKVSIAHDRDLLMKLRAEQAKALAWQKEENEPLPRRLDVLVQEMYGQDSPDKIDPAKFKAIAEPFMDMNEARIHDPLGIDKEIRTLDEKIDVFDEEIDIALTEANVRTTIEIPE